NDAAGSSRVVGDGVDEIDLTGKGSVKDAATAHELGVGCDHTTLHRHRFIKRGDLELVAKRQDACAGLLKRLLTGLDHIEISLNVRGLLVVVVQLDADVVQIDFFDDLEKSDIQLRLDDDNLGVNARPVIKVDAKVRRVEHLAIDSQNITVRRDDRTGAITGQPLIAA